MKTLQAIFFILLISLNHLIAQNLLNKPEHIAYDAQNERYLVTNYGNGKIIAIDLSGNQEIAIEGISGCLGIHIIDTTIFISHGEKIEVYGLASLEKINTITLNVNNWLDGMDNDNNGFLYAVENAGKIHRVDLNTFEDSIIVSGGLPAYPQDIAFDKYNNRLILVCWESNSPLTVINLETFEVTELSQTTSGQYDGIVMDTLKNLYVSSWMSGGRIYKWEYPYETDPLVFHEGLSGPAGLCVNRSENILAIPNFNGNEITYLPLFPVDIKENINQGRIKISNSRIYIQIKEKSELALYDLNGCCVNKRTLPPGETNIGLNNFCPDHGNGVYILTLNSATIQESIKILRP